MLQKELAKRLKARYDTKMDGNEWMKVSSDGIPLCRIKYNGQFLSNADQNLSDEYRSKIADIQGEIIFRTMNMSRKPLPCAPVSSASTACSVRMNRQTFVAVWTSPKATAKR